MAFEQNVVFDSITNQLEQGAKADGHNSTALDPNFDFKSKAVHLIKSSGTICLAGRYSHFAL